METKPQRKELVQFRSRWILLQWIRLWSKNTAVWYNVHDIRETKCPSLEWKRSGYSEPCLKSYIVKGKVSDNYTHSFGFSCCWSRWYRSCAIWLIYLWIYYYVDTCSTFCEVWFIRKLFRLKMWTWNCFLNIFKLNLNDCNSMSVF